MRHRVLYNPARNVMRLPEDWKGDIYEEAKADAGDNDWFCSSLDIDGYTFMFEGTIERTERDSLGDGIITPKEWILSEYINFDMFECYYHYGEEDELLITIN